jgi:hypothetical protein
MGSTSAASPSGEIRTGSLFSALLGRRRPAWLLAAIAVLLFLLPIGAAWMDGNTVVLVHDGTWRVALQAPTIVFYILLVSPSLERRAADVIAAYRPLLSMDEDEYDILVSKASRINPAGEVAAFVAGVALGSVGQNWKMDEGFIWLGRYLAISLTLMLGFLGWTIYAAVSSSRLTRALHSRPLRLDIFDQRPFRTVGRQSLSIALVFIGGLTLSTLLTLGRLDFLAWQNWVIYLVLTLVPLLLFFVNMRHTHRVLAAEKQRELQKVEHHIIESSRDLMGQMDAGASTGTLAADISGLAAYAERIRAAPTWPYNTAMLRTLFFSMIAPACMAVAKVVIQYLL